MSNIFEDLGASLQIVDAIEVAWRLGNPPECDGRADIETYREVHEVEGVFAYHSKEEDPQYLAKALTDHDHGSNFSLLFRWHVLH